MSWKMYTRNLKGCYFYLKISARRLPFQRPLVKYVRLKRTIDIMFRLAFPENLHCSFGFEEINSIGPILLVVG